MKSNEPTKTKSKMKKIMRFLSVAALALVGAVMTGCTNDDNIIDQRQQPENKSNVVTLTTTIGLDEEAEARGANRALAIDFTEKKATKTFDVGETMAIVYKDIYGNTVKAVSAALTAGDIASGSKSATFTFELADPDRTKDVTYIYPAAMATDAGAVNYDALATQDGTLATLSTNLDLATYTGAWTGDTSLPAATLDNQLAILALTLKNSTGASIITSGLKQVTVSDGTNTYTVTPTGSTFGTEVIYAAIRPVTAPLTFTATNGTINYTKTATSREYAAGEFFNLGLRMAVVDPGIAFDNVTSSHKGYYIAKNGKAYSTKALANSFSTAVGYICYTGAVDKYFTKFIAIALEDAHTTTTSWSDALSKVNTYASSHAITVGSTTYNSNAAGTSAAYDAVASNTSTASNSRTGAVVKGWRLPSVTDWRYIFQGINNGTPSATIPVGVSTGTAYSTGSTLRSAINTACGNTALQSYIYWSSSERSDNTLFAWAYYFSNSCFGLNGKANSNYVRAAFAF